MVEPMPVRTICPPKREAPRRTVRVSCAAAVSICVAVVSLFAVPEDRRTFFTFSAPVAVPGVTLAPGKYLFRLADTTSRSVVQVLSADGNRPYATFFAVRAERPTPPEKPEVTFMETAAGTPLPIKAWWYPGERTGYEFVYPKEQARRLAKSAKEPVLTTAAETTTAAQTGTGALTRISGTGVETAVTDESSPTSSAPAGDHQEGEIAPTTIIITIAPGP
jgi:hypothetical protein